MALTRKLLKELGVESDVISQIIEAHTETVDGLKAQRDELRDELTTALNNATRSN